MTEENTAIAIAATTIVVVSLIFAGGCYLQEYQKKQIELKEYNTIQELVKQGQDPIKARCSISFRQDLCTKPAYQE